MKYEKEALTFEDQAQRLIDRGLVADKEELSKRLQAVSYYRLSGYLYPFREKDSDRFLPGTCFDRIWERYCFDRRLRVLLLDAIERIEVSVRTQLVYHFSHKYGAFGYCCEENLPGLKLKEYIEWRESLRVEAARSKEAFKKHFDKKYDGENLPIWMAAELMSMGGVLTFYRGIEQELATRIARQYQMPAKQLESWLRSLNAARNICAHHARLWNRVLGYTPGLPKEETSPDWHLKDEHGRNLLKNDRVGVLLMICRTFLRLITPTSSWHERAGNLFDDYKQIPLKDMGLPANWRSHPLWN